MCGEQQLCGGRKVYIRESCCQWEQHVEESWRMLPQTEGSNEADW